jgi:hypothetical protein
MVDKVLGLFSKEDFGYAVEIGAMTAGEAKIRVA